LIIDPCIPESWEGFRITRNFRDAVYQIEVKNPDHVSKGVKSITVNGQTIDGPVIPIFSEGSENQVKILMG